MPSLDAIFKAYDVRGTVPDQLDPELAHAIGVGFATFAREESEGRGESVTRVLMARAAAWISVVAAAPQAPKASTTMGTTFILAALSGGSAASMGA